MAEGLFKVPAFKHQLRDHEEHADATVEDKLYQLESNPDFVVRATPISEIRRRHRELGDVQKIAETAKGLFDELREKYGINCPVTFVVAQQEGKDGRNRIRNLYSITDNIKPAEAPDSAEEQELKARRYYQLWANLLTYYEDKYASGGDYYLHDLSRGDQYVYGTKPGETDNHIYLIDADPHFSKGMGRMFALVSHLGGTLKASERAYGKRYGDFSALLERCEKLANTLRGGRKEEDA